MKKLMALLFTLILPAFSWGQGIAFPKIPALSYHNVRAFTTQNPAYFITPERFENHLYQLKENGYRTILPEEVEQIVLDGKEVNEKVKKKLEASGGGDPALRSTLSSKRTVKSQEVDFRSKGELDRKFYTTVLL